MVANSPTMDCVVLTDVVALKDVQAFAQQMSTATFTKDFPLFMPML
jgi:hypothetical protein